MRKSLWPLNCPAESIVLTCRWLKKLPKAEACKFDGFVRSRGVWNMLNDQESSHTSLEYYADNFMFVGICTASYSAIYETPQMLNKSIVSAFAQSLRLNLCVHHNCNSIEREHIEKIPRMGLDNFLSTYAMVACARARAFDCAILDPGRPQSRKTERMSTGDLFVRKYVSKHKELRARIPTKEVSGCENAIMMNPGTNADSDSRSRF